jgi:hypothetical protein
MLKQRKVLSSATLRIPRVGALPALQGLSAHN